MTLKAGEVADVANVVTLAVLIDVFVGHLLSGQLLDLVKSFQDRTRILAPTTEVIHLTIAGVLVDFLDGASDVVAVDVVTNLLALVSEDPIGQSQELGFDQIKIGRASCRERV